MPTGYTAGVVDGTIKTFEEFAQQCMRAFVCHMRDDAWDAKYKPVKPSEYKKERASSLTKELAKLEKMDENRLWALEVKRMKASIKDYEQYIKDTCEKNARLKTMLDSAIAFVPPTEQHGQIKAFMIQQLQASFESTNYWQKAIDEYKERIQQGMPKDYKKNLVAEKRQDLKRATEAYAEEVDSCEANNKWCEDFLTAIKGSR